MPLPAITPLPDPPSRTQDSDTFVANADAFLGALPAYQEEMNEFAEAIPAFISPINFNSTSTSSVAIGTGSKSFTVQADLLYYVGQYVAIVSSASPTNYMIGTVTSYSGTTLQVNVTQTSGSGTIASWNIGATPPPAASFNPRAATDGATSGTITPTAGVSDLYIFAGLTGTVTVAAPSGTPVNGQKLMLRFKDNGSTRTINWNAIFRAFGSVTLPTSTTPSKWHYVGLIYNSTDSKWDVLGAAVEQ